MTEVVPDAVHAVDVVGVDTRGGFLCVVHPKPILQGARMSTKVTDLEKFALTDIWGPYWPSHPDAVRIEGSKFPETYREGLKRIGRRRHTLVETFLELHGNREWADKVIGRIARCKYRFAPYIEHPLVQLIQHRVAELEAGDGDDS